MPHFWGNILVVTKDELVPKYFNTYDALQKSIKRYEQKPYGIKKVWGGGNGRQLLVSFESLTKEMQESIGDPRKLDHALLKFWEINSEAVRYYTSVFHFEDGTMLKTEYQEEYITNASVLIALKHLRDYKLNHWKNKKGLGKNLWEEALSFNDILEKIHGRRHTMDLAEQRLQDKKANPLKHRLPMLIMLSLMEKWIFIIKKQGTFMIMKTIRNSKHFQKVASLHG